MALPTFNDITVGERTGGIFYSDDWDAFGWQTDDWMSPFGLRAGTRNGPYATVEEAEEALRDELED